MEVERDLTPEALQKALSTGKARPDDLIRPAGTTRAWQRLGDVIELPAAPPAQPQTPPTPKPRPAAAKPPKSSIPTAIVLDDLNTLRPGAAGADPALTGILGEDRLFGRELRAAMASPQDDDRSDDDEDDIEPVYDPLAEDQAAADFTLARRIGHNKEEDLDLAAMVDVAFQLIMFFLVTASVVFFKSLEIPAPDPEKGKTADQAPSAARPIDDLLQDNILVEVDPRGQFSVDHEPIPAELLIPKLRAAREATGRTAMLLMADTATPHRHAVQAYDAANEIGLEIKVGRTTSSDE